MQVHRTARLLLVRLRHESGVHAMFERRFAHRPLEYEYLVCQVHWFTVKEVDLQLRDAVLVGQSLDIEPLFFGEIIDILNHVFELIQSIDTEGAPGLFLAAGAADRRFQRQVCIGIGLDQVEFDLRRNNGLPALLVIQVQHPFQYLPGSGLHQGSVKMVAVMDDLGSRVGRPGYDTP